MTKNKSMREMSRYIDLDIYHAVESSHPYYVQMVAHILRFISGLAVKSPKPLRVLELGAGTGLFTESLMKTTNIQVDAVELDQECIRHLEGHITSANLKVIFGNAITYCKAEYYDVVVSVFAHDHIHYNQAKQFSANIRNNLKHGGYYLMGGEILPFYSNDKERFEALITYHGFIITKALREGHYELAQIEINALKSGIEMLGDCKRHEKLFEEEMLSSPFSMEEKVKIGPDMENIGGVFVYNFKATQ